MYKSSLCKYCYFLLVTHFVLLQGSVELHFSVNVLIGFSWSGLCHTYHLYENNHTVSRLFFFYFELLTNLASSSCTGEYWSSVIFVKTSLYIHILS